MVYAIYEDSLPDVEKKLNRIARKCERHGNPFTFEIKGEEIRAIHKHDSTAMIGMPNPVEYYKFILVEVEGTARINNWECLAVMEVHDVGNVIRRINTEVEIPEKFRTSENICEHCNSKRNRNNLFVIHNTETDEWKQVGGDCLKLYTGGLNMEYITAYLDGVTELEENDGAIGTGGRHYVDVREIISRAVEIIAKTGYFNAQSNLPTKNLVGWFAYNRFDKAIEEINKDLSSARLNVRFSMQDFFKDETSATVEKIIDYYMNIEDNSEFVHNVKVMLSEGYVSPKSIGFLCYLPEGYAKYVQKQIEKAKRVETSHFGEVGKRYKDKEIQSVDVVSSWETEWGVTYVYKITLTDGNILTWKTTTGLYLERKEAFDKITFTVKAHGEYKGDKQTEITRCKVTKKIA